MSIDLSALPPPDVVEPLNFETIFATMKADAIAIAPELADVLVLESEPATKILAVAAYRELLLRARVNDAARSVMLAFSRGTTLEHLVALFGVERANGEQDDRLVKRQQLSLESFSTAGPTLGYLYYALTASPAVRDAFVYSPEPGTVSIVVLAEPSDESPNGVPAQPLLDSVKAAANADDIRPLCDTVITEPAQVLLYELIAQLELAPGVGESVVIEAALKAVTEHVQAQFMIGLDITVSGLKKALRAAGVLRVNIISPAAPEGSDEDVLIAVAQNQAARCIGITVTPKADAS
ncbi:MAG: baseplate J/gp47 family protein [Pigmentiphaga sp.]